MFLFNCISVVTNIGQQLNSVTTYKIKSRISYPFPAESQNILSLMFEKKPLSESYGVQTIGIVKIFLFTPKILMLKVKIS